MEIKLTERKYHVQDNAAVELKDVECGPQNSNAGN